MTNPRSLFKLLLPRSPHFFSLLSSERRGELSASWKRARVQNKNECATGSTGAAGLTGSTGATTQTESNVQHKPSQNVQHKPRERGERERKGRGELLGKLCASEGRRQAEKNGLCSPFRLRQQPQPNEITSCPRRREPQISRLSRFHQQRKRASGLERWRANGVARGYRR